MGATFNIQLKADPSGVKSGAGAAVDELKKVKAAALEANAAIRSIFGFYAIKEAISEVYDLTNGYQELQNRLRLMARDQDNLNGLSSATFKIAQDTRTAWEQTAMTYQRASIAAKSLGTSQKDLLQFTKEINQATILSAATNKEASSGLIQLSHGLEEGNLHGMALRSVMKDLPVVADAIAKHFHVSRGELANLGKQGLITGKAIIDSALESSAAWDEAFGNTIPTLSQSFTMLRNAAQKFFGETGTGSGVLAGLASIIKLVSDNFDILGKVLIAVLEEVIGLLLISKIISLFKTLFVLIQTNPLGVLLVALTTGILLLRQFGDDMETSTKVLTDHGMVAITVGDHLRALWKVIKDLVDVVGGAFLAAWNSLKELLGGGIDTSKTTDSFADVIDAIAKWVISLAEIIKNARTLFLDIFGGVPVILAAKFDDAFSGVLDAIRDAINKVIGTINKLANIPREIQAMFHKGDRDDLVSSRASLTEGIEARAQGGLDLLRLKQGIESTGGTADPGLLARIAANDKALSALKAQRADIQDNIDALDAKFGAAGQINPISPLAKIDHASLAAMGQGARDQLDADATLILQNINSAYAKYKTSVNIEASTRADKPKGTVSDDTGDSTTIPDPNAGKKYQQLLHQLEALIKKSNEVKAAFEQVREAEKLLATPGAENILEKVFGTTGDKVLADLTDRLHDQMFPLEAWIRKTDEAAAAMHGNSEEEKSANEVKQAAEELTKRGANVDEFWLKIIKEHTDALAHRNKVWTEEKRILDNLDGATSKYKDSLEALNNVKDQRTPQQYAREFQNITDAYTATNDASYKKWQEKMAKIDPFGSGWDQGIAKITDDMSKLATTIADTMSKAFENLENFVTSSAETGSFQWNKLIDGMEHQLDELAIKIIENYIIMQLLTNGGSDAPGVPSVASLKAVYGTGPGGGVAQYGGAHATGGSYTATGSGGVDSVPVLFHMTPGETADFTPPGTASARANTTTLGPRGRGGVHHRDAMRPIIKIVNTTDPRGLVDASDTPYGRTVIANTVRRAGKI